MTVSFHMRSVMWPANKEGEAMFRVEKDGETLEPEEVTLYCDPHSQKATAYKDSLIPLATVRAIREMLAGKE